MTHLKYEDTRHVIELLKLEMVVTEELVDFKDAKY